MFQVLGPPPPTPPMVCGWYPLPCGVGGVGRGGEVEYEVEGKSDKWWILAPDQ
jgi:hypothetical protein